MLPRLATLALLLCCSVLYANAGAAYDSGGGQYFAMIVTGDITDFGWNALANMGRVSLEQRLNISGTRFLTNVITDAQLIANVTKLVEEDQVRVIIVADTYGEDVIENLAKKYSQVTFAQYGIKSDLPNLSDILFSILDYYFIIGTFAGATTLNPKVGLVWPGRPLGSFSMVNSFYSGVKWANPENEVHIISTGSYNDPDREAGAADYLINTIGVGSLIGETNGLTIPLAAMNAGFLAVGTNGFSLASLYGQQIGLSMLHDWTPALLPLAKGINGTVIKNNYSGTFRNDAQLVDKPSHFVTAEQWARVNQSITDMKKGNFTYGCGDHMAEFMPPFKPNIAWGPCVNQSSQFGQFLSQHIIDHGNYTVPLTEIKFSRASMIGLTTTAVFLMVITCVLMAVVVIARHRVSIKNGSYIFLLNMLLGTLLVFGGVIAWPAMPSKHSCLARVWLPSLGGTIVIAALLAKNLRIMIAFHYAKRIKKAGAALYLRRFVVIVLAMMLIDIAILIAYTAETPSGGGTVIRQGTHGLHKYEIRKVCATNDSSNAALYALIVYHGVQLLVGCVISYKCRIITDPKYDERKAVAFCLYGIAFCLVVFTVLVGIIGLNVDQLVMGVSLALLLVNTFSVISIFGSKIMDLYVQEDDFTTPTQMTASISKEASSTSVGSGIVTKATSGDSSLSY